MLVKCETKSSRVKGLSFHPKLNWILASLHNGVIQLWDYRVGSLIERFEEHEGPVRGVDFHLSQPIFVSGGDDYKIRIWNYRQRRCIFTLLGHLDYIRTVQFHAEHPWILSASDDQTVRIWNWQSRSCIAILAGHNHYVMCAQFHPQRDLVASASLDQTIRVWDISGLREKTTSIRSGGLVNGGALGGHTGLPGALNGIDGAAQLMASGRGDPSGPGGSAGFLILSAQQADMFGASDAVCKFVLEGHDRGVNWTTFHPTIPLIASAADDRSIKLWRYSDSKWWEVDTLRGHFNNVSSVLFHPTKELLVSNSEDRTIRVWDINKRLMIHTFRRENDRFWVSAALRNSNALAVGHDSGMIVFKLDRERTPAQAVGQNIYYVKDRWISVYNCATGQSTSLVACRRLSNALVGGPRSLAVNTLNPSEVNILVFYKDHDGGSYDLLTFPDAGTAAASPNCIATSQATANEIVFVARNRLAALDSSTTALLILNLNNELTKRIPAPVTPLERILFGGSANHLLLKSEETVHLYDVAARKLIGEVTCPGGVRYVFWSENGQHVALVCKHHIILADNKLEFLCSVYENIRVKGGAWDPLGAFIYTTLSHIKYCLPSGDQGIIRCLAQPLYLMKVEQQKVWAVERESQVVRSFSLNCTEYLFKLALHRNQFDQVALLIRNGRLCGNAIVRYLRKKGYPAVALQFVADKQTRFTLAIEDGNLAEAAEVASALDDTTCWERLGAEAMQQGNFELAESVYQKTKNLEQLSLLYFLSGNFVKLRKMLKISELRKDAQSRYNNALLLGDSEEQIRVLAHAGQLPLAALTAKTYGHVEMMEALEEAVEGLDLEGYLSSVPRDPTELAYCKPLEPFLPLGLEAANRSAAQWPRIKEPDAAFESAMERAQHLVVPSPGFAPLQNAMDPFLEEAFKLGESDGPSTIGLPAGAGDEHSLTEEHLRGKDLKAWSDSDDEDDEAFVDGPGADFADQDESDASNQFQDHIIIGERPERVWCAGHPRVPHLVAAGRTEEALDILTKRVGLMNPAPLLPFFEHVYLSTFVSLPLLPLLPSKRLPLLACGSALTSSSHEPIQCFHLVALLESLKEAHAFFSAAKISEALGAYTRTLQKMILAEAKTHEEESQLLELLDLLRTYTLATRLEEERQRVAEKDPRREVELAAYFGSCPLQSSHQFLAIRRAMNIARKAQNYITAATFARKLIQGKFKIPAAMASSDIIEKAKKILKLSETKGVDTYAINFEAADSETPLVICSTTLTRIQPGELTVKCPFCKSAAHVAHSGSLCQICHLAELGARVLGLQFRVYE